MILDAGVFIALENPSKRRVIVALLAKMLASGDLPMTNEAALAQAWRDPSRQVAMAMLVKTSLVYPFGDAKTIGRRCAETQTSDIVDASLAVLSDQLGATILTTDPVDMKRLNAAFQLV